MSRKLLAGLLFASIPINLYAGKMDFTNVKADSIETARLDGSDRKQLLLGGTPDPVAIDASAGKLYWAAVPEGRIERANLDGSGREIVLTSRAPIWPAPCARR